MTWDYNDITLLEILSVIFRDDSRLPHLQEFPKALYEATMRKYFACTEKERRMITRSDPEFMAILRDAIVQRCGFSNEEEAFGKANVIPEIPRISRGNGLVWFSAGDPEESETEDMAIITKKLARLISIVLQKLQEFYPDYHERCIENSKETMVKNMNTSDKDRQTIEALQNVSESDFNKIAIPKIITPIVMRVAEINRLNATQQNDMSRTITEAVWNDLE